MENLKQEAIKIVNKYPDRIGVNLLKLHLHIGTVAANKLLEELEKDNIITKFEKEKGRTLIIKQ